MKILLFDIETSPIVSYTWGMYEQDVIKKVKDWRILSFAYKWLDEKQTHAYALSDFPSYKKDKEDDGALVKKLYELISEADVIIAHNGDKFDIKKTNTRFAYHGLLPTPPYKTVDTLKVAKRHFRFDSNRLNDLGEFLGVGSKVKTGGFDLWAGCLAGDSKSWRLMKKYNAQDVVLLEKVYKKLAPWMTNHPYVGEGCSCGSMRLIKRGFLRAKGGKTYQRYQCTSCGSWSQQKLHGRTI